MWSAIRKDARLALRFILLSTSLFFFIGLWRYFEGVWNVAPKTFSPLNTDWTISVIIAVATGSVLLFLLSLANPRAYRIVATAIGGSETGSSLGELQPTEGRNYRSILVTLILLIVLTA